MLDSSSPRRLGPVGLVLVMQQEYRRLAQMSTLEMC
jgi:hypothetical protein